MNAEDSQPRVHGHEPPSSTGILTGPHAGSLGRRLVPTTGPQGRVERAVAVVKPGMRGWLHAGMFPLALVGGIVLVAVARSASAAVACAVYAVCALLLFGTSAVYHRGTWGPRGQAVLRRVDHANIFLIIAGTYTPLAVLLLSARGQAVLLSVVWSGAAAGIAFRIWWITAPRWLYTLCYIALGWAAVFYLPAFAAAGGAAVVALVVTGGLLYTAGALVYGLKRPDPWPRWFGFHEIFHALTIAAFTAHYTAILLAAA